VSSRVHLANGRISGFAVTLDIGVKTPFLACSTVAILPAFLSLAVKTLKTGVSAGLKCVYRRFGSTGYRPLAFLALYSRCFGAWLFRNTMLFFRNIYA
jgi:hypothetical protein